MIIYISDEDNKGMLDRLAEQYEWELLTEVMNRGSLNKFIREKLQVIANLQYLVLDCSCISESDQELSGVIETICVMWDTKVILLKEELTDDKGEQQKVIYGEQVTSLYKYQDNLAGSLEYLLKGEKIPAEEIYEGIWIGVLSANSGAGATHISVGLTNYIKQCGESVCYVEANESGDLGAMASFYGMEQIEENHYQRNSLDYWHQSIDPEKKFAVLDLGKYGGAKLNLFNQCKVKILVTDGKPYRMADALNVLRYINDENTRLWLNFSGLEEYERLCEEYLGNLNNPVGNLGWHKDMFIEQDVLYKEALSRYIKIVPDRQSKIAFILNPGKLKLKGRKKQPFKLPEIKQEETADYPEQTKEQIKEQAEQIEEAVQEDYFISDSETDCYDYAEQIPQDSFEDEAEGIPLEQEAVGKTEEPLPEQEIVEVKQGKGIPVKGNLIWFLMIGAGVLGILCCIPEVKDYLASGFPFNNHAAEQTTELVDEDLNINSDIKISVLEVDGADGYEVSYSTDKDFNEKTTVVVEVETADKAVESLTAGKTYYVRVRAFKFNEDGTKVYGEYTEVQEIET